MDDATPSPPNTRRAQLYGWAVFVLVVIVATVLFGPLALIVLSLVAGIALIATGARSTGWPRPTLIAVGAVLAVLPIIALVDIMTGSFVVAVR